ncbi:MAG: hypothetical protein DRP03_01915 [Candidatus Aenigmatarchaeota archaeon]|nr:MAG: hypothetical protein DRP03_01915 [Candidatus Aenigmarchaeota archaeon]
MKNRKLLFGFLAIIMLATICGVWFSLDKITRCALIYGKNICNFYAMMDIANNNPSISDFDKMMDLCIDMSDVPKKDGCFEYVAQTIAPIDINKAKEACDEIKGFDGVKSREICYNRILQAIVEKIVFYENGRQEIINLKSEKGKGIASLLTRKLHELNLQATCVFSEEDIREIKQKDRVIELIFKKPIDITISQWIEPEERYHIPTDEKGYRILENVKTAIFILEDNQERGLEAHILIGHGVEGRTGYSCWAINIKKEGKPELDKSWIDGINRLIKTESEEEKPEITLISVYDNYQVNSELKTAWGFATIIKTPKELILFDTGGDSKILLSNMKKLGINLTSIKKVVISHIHNDHLGGLEGFLERNSNVTVFIPSSFPQSIKNMIVENGAKFVEISAPRKISDFIYITGELYGPPKEQSLIIDSKKGLVIITGCAHPGIVNIVKKAKELMKRDKVYLVLGGFHHPPLSCVKELKELGVEKVAPSHCTGDLVREAFRKEYKGNFIEYGVGKIIEIK